MNLAEIKEKLKHLTVAELEDLALHIEFLRQTADPEWREEMFRRARRAKAGQGLVSQEDLEALHQRLISEGR